MIHRLEEEKSPRHALAMVKAARRSGQHALETRSMWFALADLLVVHHPGWPSQSRLPVGPLAEHPSSAQATHERRHQPYSIQAMQSVKDDHHAAPHFGGFSRDG